MRDDFNELAEALALDPLPAAAPAPFAAAAISSDDETAPSVRSVRCTMGRGRDGELVRERRTQSRRWSSATVRAAGVGVVLAAIAVSGCGASASRSGSLTAVAPPVASATAPAVVPTTATTTPVATTYDTRLERDLARSFEDAFLTGPAPPTLSQIPPRTDLFVREPATVCEHVHRAAYRCTVTYDVRTSRATQHLVYEVRQGHDCFTAIAAASAEPRTLHRLSSC